MSALESIFFAIVMILALGALFQIVIIHSGVE